MPEIVEVPVGIAPKAVEHSPEGSVAPLPKENDASSRIRRGGPSRRFTVRPPATDTEKSDKPRVFRYPKNNEVTIPKFSKDNIAEVIASVPGLDFALDSELLLGLRDYIEGSAIADQFGNDHEARRRAGREDPEFKQEIEESQFRRNLINTTLGACGQFDFVLPEGEETESVRREIKTIMNDISKVDTVPVIMEDGQIKKNEAGEVITENIPRYDTLQEDEKLAIVQRVVKVAADTLNLLPYKTPPEKETIPTT